jgi:hypothetical protein
MQAWRDQAASLIWASDMRESIAASRAAGDQVLAELRRRAMPAGSSPLLANRD